MNGEEKSNIMVVEPKCTYKRSVELPLIHHNLMNEPNPEKVIDIVEKGYGDSRKKKVQTFFGDREIRCPTAAIGRRIVNFSPGRAGFNAYLKGYFGKNTR